MPQGLFPKGTSKPLTKKKKLLHLSIDKLPQTTHLVTLNHQILKNHPSCLPLHRKVPYQSFQFLIHSSHGILNKDKNSRQASMHRLNFPLLKENPSPIVQIYFYLFQTKSHRSGPHSSPSLGSQKACPHSYPLKIKVVWLCTQRFHHSASLPYRFNRPLTRMCTLLDLCFTIGQKEHPYTS